MTTATIRAAAQAAYRARFAGREGRSWDGEGNAVQIRWELVAARVLNGEITTARALRDAYLDGYDGCKDWPSLGVFDRKRWVDALDAILRGRWEAAA